MSVRFVRVMNLSMAGATRPDANDTVAASTVSRSGAEMNRLCAVCGVSTIGFWSVSLLRGRRRVSVFLVRVVVGLAAHQGLLLYPVLRSAPIQFISRSNFRLMTVHRRQLRIRGNRYCSDRTVPAQ